MNLEKKIIEMLKKNHPDHIGDDAAIINFPDNDSTVISQDQLVENVHFRTQYFSPADLAHKALHVNLSDIAAMGGIPKYILCGIAINKSQYKYARQFLNYLSKMCQQFNIQLIGGDTTAADSLFISITIIGSCKKPVQRHTAKPGDVIACIGNLGWAYLGLKSLEQGSAERKKFITASLRPTAKIAEGQWLATHNFVTAMMDISDGILIDLENLCRPSALGAIIELDNINLDQQFIKSCKKLNLDPLETALIGGEDYGLLITIEQNNLNYVLDQFQNIFGYQIQILGKIINSKKIKILKNNKKFEPNLKPFQHF